MTSKMVVVESTVKLAAHIGANVERKRRDMKGKMKFMGEYCTESLRRPSELRETQNAKRKKITIHPTKNRPHLYYAPPPTPLSLSLYYLKYLLSLIPHTHTHTLSLSLFL
jgi:hypothetical protein